ncbi:MAG: hypothetical protein IKA36_05160 [Clostridia bacterium]|nr:hypothetical protein [Clostridia bacterium]
MSYKKVQVYTLTATLGIVKSAVSRVTGSSTSNIDSIVYNSLNRAISKKKANSKGVK